MTTLSDVIDILKANITADASTSRYSVDINTIDENSDLTTSGADHHTLMHEIEDKFDIKIAWCDEPGDEEPAWKTGTVQTVVDSVTAKL